MGAESTIEEQAVLLLDEINQYLGSHGGWEHCRKLLTNALTQAHQAGHEQAKMPESHSEA